MNTKRFNSFQIKEAAALLRKGEVIGIPTETVYGLAAPIFLEPALQKIFSLKKRPIDNPLIVHASSISMVKSVAETGSPFFARLAALFWPGPLTLILPRKPHVPSLASAGHPTIAVRIPSHPLAKELIEEVGMPLAAPSANLSGRPSPTTAAHVLEDFEGQIPAVLDGGACHWGLESTVLSLVGPLPVLLRPGSVTRETLGEALQVQLLSPTSKETSLSPGMKYRHYAPRGNVHLVQDLAQIKGEYVISKEACPPFFHRPLEPSFLYRWLREADLLQIPDIWVLLDPVSLQDEALMDRLRRASE